MKNTATKAIIRRLPPKLTKEDFQKIIDPIPPHTYFRFCEPDPTLGNSGLCRAYITFCDLDSLFDFKERFDNYVFIDSEGNESYAIVEFAICQSLVSTKDSSSKKSRKVDRKQGTLDNDPEYASFLQSLESSQNENKLSETESKKTPWEAVLEQIQAQEAKKQEADLVTPLTAYLNQPRRSKNRKKNTGNSSRKPKTEKVVHRYSRRPQDSKSNLAERPHGPSSNQTKQEEGNECDSRTIRQNKSGRSTTPSDYDKFPPVPGSEKQHNETRHDRTSRNAPTVDKNSMSSRKTSVIDRDLSKYSAESSDTPESSRPKANDLAEPGNARTHGHHVGDIGAQNAEFSQMNRDKGYRLMKSERQKQDFDRQQAFEMDSYSHEEHETSSRGADRYSNYSKPKPARGKDNRRPFTTVKGPPSVDRKSNAYRSATNSIRSNYGWGNYEASDTHHRSDVGTSRYGDGDRTSENTQGSNGK